MKANSNPKHIAIIMDGNGRWASQRKMIRSAGHKAGIETIDSVLKLALKNQINYLTLFAFSTENWNRPKKEVEFLILAFKQKITNKKTIDFFVKNNIRFKWLGFKDKMPKGLINNIKSLENITKDCIVMTLTIAFNYGGKQDIIESCIKCSGKKITKEIFLQNLSSSYLPDVDLLIRTGNEKRISNFILWQLTYSEIIFEKTLWPDYDSKTWIKNLKEFKNRERKFGAIK